MYNYNQYVLYLFIHFISFKIHLWFIIILSIINYYIVIVIIIYLYLLLMSKDY